MTGIDDKEMMDRTLIENKTISSVMSTTSIPDDPPIMAVLPLNSSTKLDQEPNPFEHSFSGATASVEMKERKDTSKLILPPVASITSPSLPPTVIGGGLLPKDVTDQFSWDTLRTGPLSPSMLQGPANPEEYYNKVTNSKLGPSTNYPMRTQYSDSSMMHYHIQTPHQMIKKEKEHSDLYSQNHYRERPRKRSSTSHTDEDSQSINSNGSQMKRRSYRKTSSREYDSDEDDEDKSRRGKLPDDDEKRKNFLERNRIAALKCRQRKKQWLNNLQARVEYLSSDNERLQVQSESLKEEIVNLKTLLLAHKECPIAQSNGFHPNAIQKNAVMPMMRHNTNNTNHNNNNNNNNNSSSYSLPNSRNNSTTSISSHTQFQRANIVTMPVQSTQSNQQGMLAGGGSTTIMRF
ncbi:hypothetical protein BDB01DRAFT_306121 [Pilobolus umbonatus]|nr:hypothetical protein BDB01DRAFT_306121 [Pilobolus umbonatus]